MEIFELKYFLAVAKVENMNKASENINVSAGSLSKAITRLESELKVSLFFKSGRGIRLTPEGMLLKKRAIEILQMEEATKLELMGNELGQLTVSISSEEILQSSYGLKIAQILQRLFPLARIEFQVHSEDRALEQVLNGEVHLALVTQNVTADVASKVISKVDFQTCASEHHPLFKKFTTKQTIPVEEILKYPFALPETSVLGRIAKSSSLDGWRDDKLPRELKYQVSGLKLLENLIQEGLALGYLPNYFIERAGLIPVKVSGCPYTCQQTVRVIAKDPKSLGWLNQLWNQL